MDFVVNRNDHVRVGQGYIEFNFGKRRERMNAEDIAAFSINSGTFSVKHKDASWLGSRGKYSFSYANVGNAQLFLIALNAFVGLRFQ